MINYFKKININTKLRKLWISQKFQKMYSISCIYLQYFFKLINQNITIKEFIILTILDSRMTLGWLFIEFQNMFLGQTKTYIK